MSRSTSPNITPVKDDAPLPNVLDFYGRQVDPRTGLPMPEGQEGPNSIFNVPSTEKESTGKEAVQMVQVRLGDAAEVTSMPWPQILAQMRRQGFQGNVVMNITPHPDDEDKLPLPPPSPPPLPVDAPYETSGGNIYRTTCAYCWAIVQDKEREKGFTLQEFRQAASKGCESCDVLHDAVGYFARLLFEEYNEAKVRIRQSGHGLSRLLSQTKKVSVCFDEYGGETMVLNFSGPPKDSEDDANLGGRIADTSSYAAIVLIRKWLDKCIHEHPQCAIPATSILPKRVLDVANSRVRLVETNREIAPYVTLSHCWGLKTITKATTASLEAMKQDIPWRVLTKTFQDAIMITWKLGFRYIWIDGLCILQDSKADWEYHASQMAQIFSNSQLTIAASRGSNSQEGCFSSRLDEPLVLHSAASRKIHNMNLWLPYTTDGKDRDGWRKNYTVWLKPPHGLYHRKRPKEPLLKRAWVFQEQLLSPRIIHFASGELYFECKSHVVCECSDWSLRSSSLQWETRWRKAHRVLLNRAIHQKLDSEQKEQAAHDFEAYRSLVETFSELNITAELDRLPALSGVTFGRKDEYLAGLWRSLLFESLHWFPVSVNLRGVMARRPYTYRAPTWSWASMEAIIRHAETDFWKKKWSSKSVAKIIGASCTPEGLDPRGRVVSGYLRIRGPMDEARVTDIGFCERELSQSAMMLKIMKETRPSVIDESLVEEDQAETVCTYATLKKGALEERCYLDLPLALCRTEPAEVSVGQEVTLLVLSSSTLLVLKRVPDTPGAYSRIGTFRPKKEGWMFDNGRDSIFIL